MVRSILLAAALVPALFVATVGQSSPPTPKQPMDTIMVFGDGFMFSMKEPAGWQCVCDERASKYEVNAVVFPGAAASRAHHVMIRIRVNEKSDENTTLDLQADMQQYRKKYPKVEFIALNVAHPKYRTYPKLFAFPNEFYEYVAYVNPGPHTPFVLAVSMSKEKTPATSEELAAYKKVVQTLNVFTEPAQ